MKGTKFLSLTIIFLCGCSDSPKSTDSKEKDENKSAINIEKVDIQLISDWPDDIDGCSCYSSRNKSEFEKNEYIFMDDYGDLALMKINGRLERFKLTKSDTLTSSEHSVETWTNDNFEVIIETNQIGRIEETWQHQGKLILQSTKGETIEQKIYGECGC